MNPSTTGWVKKYFKYRTEFAIFTGTSIESSYQKLRNIGFTYGIIDKNQLPERFSDFEYTQSELSKICFIQFAEKLFYQVNPLKNETDFMQTLLDYYNELIPQKANKLTGLFTSKNPYNKLEHIFKTRWKEGFISESKDNENIFNTLLWSVDLLTFEYFLNEGKKPKKHALSLLELLVEIVLAVKNQKVDKNENDYLLIKYLQKTLDIQVIDQDENTAAVIQQRTWLATHFLADFTVVNSWNNLEKKLKLPALTVHPFNALNFSTSILEQSTYAFQKFINQHNQEYPYFRSSNLFNNILQNSSKNIELLLHRNKKRLLKEVQKNTKLMGLLVDSTYRELNKSEKKMVKKQLIEVCKTIPSLTIFVLPGGSLILPLVLKFIPQLLPSSFNENNEEV